mmetsp:Transcript_24309/g.43830  ORF Transcript_24309/g.43830 Transcript_24309/m.43830 type:complete len:277 (+) Transcript_24309:201-1031(+)
MPHGIIDLGHDDIILGAAIPLFHFHGRRKTNSIRTRRFIISSLSFIFPSHKEVHSANHEESNKNTRIGKTSKTLTLVRIFLLVLLCGMIAISSIDRLHLQMDLPIHTFSHERKCSKVHQRRLIWTMNFVFLTRDSRVPRPRVPLVTKIRERHDHLPKAIHGYLCEMGLVPPHPRLSVVRVMPSQRDTNAGVIIRGLEGEFQRSAHAHVGEVPTASFHLDEPGCIEAGYVDHLSVEDAGLAEDRDGGHRGSTHDGVVDGIPSMLWIVEGFDTNISVR